MTFARYPANQGVSNTVTVDENTAWYVRFSYRNLRQSGASARAARQALYDLAFQASLFNSTFDFNPVETEAEAERRVNKALFDTHTMLRPAGY